MAQISLRVNDEVKEGAEQVFNEMGLNMSEVVNVFLKKVAKEQRIPFELSVDPFYSESNIRHLESVVDTIENGHARLVEHDIVEVN